jgi:hypothetical protein
LFLCCFFFFITFMRVVALAICVVAVPEGRSVMAKGLRSVQQVSSSSQGVHLL